MTANLSHKKQESKRFGQKVKIMVLFVKLPYHETIVILHPE